MSREHEENEENIFRILLATDIHLGYNEKHPDRGNDSFVTFEEILVYARDLQVDFILLGGDLFHENKPSRRSLQRCVDLLRKYCLGPGGVAYDFLSDPDVNFRDCATPQVNFEDPNLRISVPIFSIHGNHDDPCGEGNYSIMDMLATTGFVNYFGKIQNFSTLKFQPILLKKGETLLSIYGIGSMNDDRLFRLFEEEKVQFEVPAEYEGEWFNLLVLHQNRARHGSKNYMGEHLLPDFLDLVFWGHEHECRLEPEDCDDKFRVTQPGSSVATSLCPGEAVAKHVGLLKIYKREFVIEPLPLRTVRPFVFDTISLSEFSEVGNQLASEEVVEMVRSKIGQMLKKAKTLVTGHPAQPELPLLRLRIEHESDQQFGSPRVLEMKLGLDKTVSNFDDVIKLVRKRAGKDVIEADVDEDAWNAVFSMDTINMIEGQLENLLVDYFKESTKDEMLVMHERTLAEGVRSFVEKMNEDAFSDIIQIQAEQTKKMLDDKLSLEKDSIRDAFTRIRTKRNADPKSVVDEAHTWLSGQVPITKKSPKKEEFSYVDTGMDEDFEPQGVLPARGRTRGRASRARAPRAARGTGRGRAKNPVEDDDECSIIEDPDSPKKVAVQERAKCSKVRGTRGRGKSSIEAAFTKQSQMSVGRSAAPLSSTPAQSSRSSSARGVCYVSDSDD